MLYLILIGLIILLVFALKIMRIFMHFIGGDDDYADTGHVFFFENTPLGFSASIFGGLIGIMVVLILATLYLIVYY